MTDQDLIAEYQSGIGSTKLAKKLGVAQSTVSRRLKKLGVTPRKFQGSVGTNAKYSLSSSIFHTIDTEKKAYWLGFLFADGSVVKYLSRNTEQYKLDFTLKEADSHMVEAFKSFLNYTGPLYKNATTARNPYVKLVVHNKNI